MKPSMPDRNKVILAVVGIVTLIGLIIAAYGWPGSGFGERRIDPNSQPYKTLWDWLGLFLIPAVLAVGGYLFNRSERETQQRIADERRQAEEERAAALAAKDRELAADAQREGAFQHYLDRIAELMLSGSLVPNKVVHPGSQIARARTLSILQQLGSDGERKGSVIRFLYQASLINGDIPSIDLDDADLDGVDLSGARLRGVNLQGASLRLADFQVANLKKAHLEQTSLDGAQFIWTNMQGANLSFASAYSIRDHRDGEYKKLSMFLAELRGAILTSVMFPEANLSSAHLEYAHLEGGRFHGTDFSEADLTGADLSNAIFMNANITKEQLAQAKSIASAMLPNNIWVPPDGELDLDNIHF